MISELSFLIELLLNHKLPKETKDAIASRIKDLDELSGCRGASIPHPARPVVNQLGSQAPSTQAILDRNPDLAAALIPPPPVAVVAQTQATVAALASRNNAISESLSGKIDKVSGRPRKW